MEANQIYSPVGEFSVDSRYNPAAIEEKWQQTWLELGLDKTPQIVISPILRSIHVPLPIR